MYDQLLDLLRGEKPSTMKPTFEDEVHAVVGICLRWSTYFAVLADESKPIWSAVSEPKVSRVGDSEMARINIEASSALERWMQLRRENRSSYDRLVVAARSLPLPTSASVRPGASISEHLPAELRAFMRAAPQRAGAADHPLRALANYFVNAGWRNGEIEDIHAGESVPRPVAQRRFRPAETRAILRQFGSHAGTIVSAMEELEGAPDKAIADTPLFLAYSMMAPSEWSLTEPTRDVLLQGHEP